MTMRLRGILAFTTAVFCCGAPGAADRMVAVTPADGAATLVKTFSLTSGTTITGVEFESNVAVYPAVSLRRAAHATLGSEILASRSNVTFTSPGTASLTWTTPVPIDEAGEYQLAIRLPETPGARVGVDEAVTPVGSFVAAGEGQPLMPIRGDLAARLTTTGGSIGKAKFGAEGRTFVRVTAPGNGRDAIRVEFGVGERGNVTLAIYDVAGRLVRRLVDEALPAGEFVSLWDRRRGAGSRVSRGIYMLRLQVGERVLVKRIVLAR